MSKKIYVLRVRSGLEDKIIKIIKDELLKQDLFSEVEYIFVPKMNIHGDNKSLKQIIPIKGSIFLKMTMSDRIEHVITSIPQVLEFYKSGGVYATIDEKSIDKIKANIENEEVILKNKKDNFVAGEDVAIVNHEIYSTFKQGKIEQVKDDVYYVSVLVLGQPTVIKIEKEYLKKI